MGSSSTASPSWSRRARLIAPSSSCAGRLSASVTDADPHKADARLGRVSPRDNAPEARRTADVLNRFIDRASAILRDHPLNIERRRDGHAEANYLLLRGAGHYREVPSFRERYGLSACCIAGGGMYKGIGRYLG